MTQPPLTIQAHYHDRLDWVEAYAGKLPQNAFWTVYTKSERGLKGPKRVVQLPNVGREVGLTALHGSSHPRGSQQKPAKSWRSCPTLDGGCSCRPPIHTHQRGLAEPCAP